MAKKLAQNPQIVQSYIQGGNLLAFSIRTGASVISIIYLLQISNKRFSLFQLNMQNVQYPSDF